MVQPNIDPYNEQYTLLRFGTAWNGTWPWPARKADDSVDFVVSPESAIQENIWEDRIDEARSLARYANSCSTDFPKAGYVIGASTYYHFQPGEKLSATARKFRNSEGHYDAYNSAVYLDSTSH
ncbi:MAG: hypothetical protein MZU84_07905 [Sphingobacterium sp.]|nr:hypothetical protein [Sphingobacterium sp.]